MRELTIDEQADRLLEATPDFEQVGGKATSPEGALRDMAVEQIEPNIVVFYNEHESIVKPAGWIMIYFMDSPAAAAEMKAGKIAYPMFMPGSLSMRFGGYSMIDAIWKRPKKQRWWKPEDAESEAKKKHVVGALEAYKTKDGIYVDNLSVRPGWKRNTIGTKLMQVLKKRWPGLPMVHSQPTPQGRKFLKKTGDYQPERDKEARITGPVTVEDPAPEKGVVESILLTVLEDEHDANKEWIGVDFDGTLAEYGGWDGATKCGKPIPKMVARVRRWLRDDKKVKIFTARADDEESVKAIKKWLKENDLPDLEITNLKDQYMVKLWDDKAVAVEKNTGEVKESEQPSDYEEWEPSQMALVSMHHHLLQMYRYGRHILDLEDTGHAYKIDFDHNQAALIEGSPKDPEHEKMKKLLTVLGFTVHDYPPIPPMSPEQSFSESRLNESPSIDKIKKNRQSLTPEEKAQIPKDLPAGDGASIVKGVVDGQTWYACYTHRAGQVRKTFKEMLKVYPKIASTA